MTGDLKRRGEDADAHRRRPCEDDRVKTAIDKPRIEASEGINTADTLI